MKRLKIYQKETCNVYLRVISLRKKPLYGSNCGIQLGHHDSGSPRRIRPYWFSVQPHATTRPAPLCSAVCELTKDTYVNFGHNCKGGGRKTKQNAFLGQVGRQQSAPLAEQKGFHSVNQTAASVGTRARTGDKVTLMFIQRRGEKRGIFPPTTPTTPALTIHKGQPVDGSWGTRRVCHDNVTKMVSKDWWMGVMWRGSTWIALISRKRFQLVLKFQSISFLYAQDREREVERRYLHAALKNHRRSHGGRP